MSQENVEIVRQTVEALDSDDPAQAWLMFHPEVEFTSALTEATTYIGLEGMREFAANLDAVWEGWHREDSRFLDAGGDRIVWLYRVVGQGKKSGVSVDQPIGIVWTLRDRLIWRGQAYLDHAEALKAVGLEE